MAKKGPKSVKCCPDCGCVSLEKHFDGKGEAFYLCLRCGEFSTESGLSTC